jgi:hypothetical protein
MKSVNAVTVRAAAACVRGGVAAAVFGERRHGHADARE